MAITKENLRQLLEAALFSVRGAERIAVEHVRDVERASHPLGLAEESHREDEARRRGE